MSRGKVHVTSRRDLLAWALGYPMGSVACAQVAGLSDEYHLVSKGGGGAGGLTSSGGVAGGTRGGSGGTGGPSVGGTGGAAGESPGGAGGDAGADEAGTSGSSNGGSSNAGSSNAGSSNAGSSNAGSSNAGKATGGSGTRGGAGGSTGGGTSAGEGGGAGAGEPEVIGGEELNVPDACVLGTPPTFANAVESTHLPDPFKFLDGNRLKRKADWQCLRAELAQVAQASIYGQKMPPPDSVTANYDGVAGRLTISATVGSTTRSFSVGIPAGGSASNPVPAIIAISGSNVPSIPGVAKIAFSPSGGADGVVAASDKTWPPSGVVNDLYGNAAARSGSLIAWAWGLSRIIDALELHPELGIDAKRIGVLGCSSAAKGAIAMGAFDERVKLTIAQEAGTGGPGCWRLSTLESDLGQGNNIQHSSGIISEANWQGLDFQAYAVGENDKLPLDQHTVLALCAPRALLILENDLDFLGPVPSYCGGKAASLVYEALGLADRIGVSVSANHGHCIVPTSHTQYITAFVNRFLLGLGDMTSGVDELVSASSSKLLPFVLGDYVDWSAPTLSGSLAWDPFA